MHIDTVVIVGMGVVGSALYNLAMRSRYRVYGIDIDPRKSVNRIDEVPRGSGVALHVAYPYSPQFIDSLCHYAEVLRPEMIVIHSTVKPGTSIEIYKRVKRVVAYSPVRGYHRCMDKHISWWSKWVAVLPPQAVDEVVEHLKELGFQRIRTCSDPTSLELAKLWETVLRAILIASWQELHRIARMLGADISVVMEFVGEVHRVLGDRPIMYPGIIGGHCLIPNTEILNSVRRSKLFEFVLESNAKRVSELKDPDTAKEVEKAKEIAERFMLKDYFECKDIDLGYMKSRTLIRDSGNHV